MVVGAGIAGLTSTLDLARRGAAVTVVEAASGSGGKLRPAEVDGRLFDVGPTVLTMRAVFDDLLADVGSRLEDYLELEPARLLARHAWADGACLDLHADPDATLAAIGDFAGVAEARRFAGFRQRAERIHNTLDATFMRASRPSLTGLLRRAGIAGLPGIMAISPFRSLWQDLGRHFRHPRLRQLFGRYATYCGSSPFLAPATLMLIAHVELRGVWRIVGGMHRLATCLEDRARELGATFRFDTPVATLLSHHGRITGVRLADGTSIEADAVIFNGDQAALAAGRLGAAGRAAVPPASRSRRSLSAQTWAWAGAVRGFDVSHHNVFFSDDYEGEFDALFRKRSLPATPTVYLCAQDRPAAATAHPEADPERLFCLVNAPATGDAGRPDSAEIQQCEKATFAHLARCGLQISPNATATLRRTPLDWEQLYPATGGALYGQATHGWRAAFDRLGSRCRMPGLYLAGGSVHPGAGVPMAGLSGRLAATALLEDLDSNAR